MPIKPRNLRKILRGAAIAAGAIAPFAAGGLRLAQRAANRTNTTKASYVRRPYAKKTRRVRRGRNVTNMTSQGSGVASHSKCSFKSYGNPQNRLLKKIGSPNSWVSQRQAFTYVMDGFQGVGMFPWATQSEMVQIAQSSIYTANGGSGDTSLGNYPMRYVYQGTFGEISFTNATNHAIDLDIYDLYLKRDLQRETPYIQVDASGEPRQCYWNNPIGAWELGVNNAQNYINRDNFDTYPTSPDISGYGSEYYNYLGSSPFDSQLFKDFFGVSKRTHVQMPLGATHKHHCTFTLNKLVDSRMTNVPDIEGWKGYTRYTMWVVRGYPINSAPVERDMVVTTAGALITAVQSMRTKFTYVLDNRQNVRYFDNLQSLAPDESAVVNTASGTFENPKNTFDNFPA